MPRRTHKKKQRTLQNGYLPRAPKGKNRARSQFRFGAQRDDHYAEADRRMREAEERAA